MKTKFAAWYWYYKYLKIVNQREDIAVKIAKQEIWENRVKTAIDTVSARLFPNGELPY